MKDSIFAIERSTEADKTTTQQLEKVYELQFQTLRTEIKTIYWVLEIIDSALAITVTVALAVFAK